MDIVVLSGGFDPLHEGHIAMLDHASKAYDYVIVGINSDEWLTRKKGRPFMSFKTREAIIGSLRQVNDIWAFDDSDDSAIDLIKKIRERFPDDNITFGNGGDRNGNFAEFDYCKENGIDVNDELGGKEKSNSSSWMLRDWKDERTDRKWGHWKVLHDYGTCKVKELVVYPNSELSWQSHENRNELWFIRDGTASIYYSSDDQGQDIFYTQKGRHQTFFINRRKWHQLVNEEDSQNLSIIEVQFGSECVESDIIRDVRPRTDPLPSS